VFGQKIFIHVRLSTICRKTYPLGSGGAGPTPPKGQGTLAFSWPQITFAADGSPRRAHDGYCASIGTSWGSGGPADRCPDFMAGLRSGRRGKGAVAEIVASPTSGLESMFSMMNAARFDQVGIRGHRGGRAAYPKKSRPRNVARETDAKPRG